MCGSRDRSHWRNPVGHGIAVDALSDYVAPMAPLLQKLCALMAVLAFVLSLTGGANAWDMSGDMATTAGLADTPSPGCDGADCPDHVMAGAVCYPACSGTLAVLASGLGPGPCSGQDLQPLATPARLGQTSPPEPSPPRFSVLS